MRLCSDDVARLEETAYQIRRLTVEMITYGQWGHIGGSFSLAEILAVPLLQCYERGPGSPDMGRTG